MRYRALSSSGDYTFGQKGQNYLVNSAECVRQAVLTGLLLIYGEFFLDTTKGVMWEQNVVGQSASAPYDQTIKEQILDTQGVVEIVNYSSYLDTVNRKLWVNVDILSLYGPFTINFQLPNPIVYGFGVGGYGANPYGV